LWSRNRAFSSPHQLQGTAVWKQPRLKLKAATNDVVFNEEINVHGLPNAFELLDEDEDVVTNATSASFADGLFIRFEGNLYSLTVPAKSSGTLPALSLSLFPSCPLDLLSLLPPICSPVSAHHYYQHVPALYQIFLIACD
jgi:hypothetical protein